MKYARLTKEQFEELHLEFINFLATQSITGDEWEKIKTKQPEAAEQELDVFSDLIWEGVLSKASYLQNTSAQQLFLFHISEENMKLIAVNVTDDSVDITTEKGFDWLKQHLMDDAVELFTATKEYSNDRKLDVFQLIKQGAQIIGGELYIEMENYLK